jgi:hypothetical protein
MQVTLTHTVAAEVVVNGRELKVAVAMSIHGPDRDGPGVDHQREGSLDQAAAYTLHAALLAALEIAIGRWPATGKADA